MNRRSLAALGVLLTGALSGCSASAHSGASTTTGSTAITSVARQDRGGALDLAGIDLDGRPLRLSDYRGKVVVINIWGSWCGPCRAEAPDLEAVASADQATGVQFIGINTRDLDTSAAKAFVRAAHLTYPNFHDPDGSLLLRLPPGTVNPQTIPTTLVLDRQGRVAARALQPVTRTQLDSLVNPLIQEQP